MLKAHIALLVVLAFPSIVAAGIFEFLNNQFQHDGHVQSIEEKILTSDCLGYMCADTFACVKGPADCPCQFPSSQLKCVLPEGGYICISKPAGDFNGRYDGDKAALVDAKDDTIRDCGWVRRIYG